MVRRINAKTWESPRLYIEEIHFCGYSFLRDEHLLEFIVADVNFGMFLWHIFVHREILIIFGLFFAITKYAILMFRDLMVVKEETTAKFSNLKQINYFIMKLLSNETIKKHDYSALKWEPC